MLPHQLKSYPLKWISLVLVANFCAMSFASLSYGADTWARSVQSDTDARAAAKVSETDPGVQTLMATANSLFWERRFDEARRVVVQILDSGKACAKTEARCYVNLAICNLQLEDLSTARRQAIQAAKMAEPGSVDEADALCIEAHCYACEDEDRKAIELYERALTIAEKSFGEWNCDLAVYDEGLAACCMRERQWQKAKALYLKSAQLDLLKYGPDNTHFGWSLLSLSSATGHLNETALTDLLYRKVFWNFRHQNEQRILAELPQPVSDTLKQNLIKQLYGTNGYADETSALEYIGKGIPASVRAAPPAMRPHDFSNWYKRRVGREQAPGLAYFDPNVPLKGLIVAIHGLGLSHNAYIPFAKRIEQNGFGVVAFDVRGFGTYRNDLLYQRADFTEIINDLKRILTALRRDYPGTPIFILGESMGGAIALRLGAVAPDLVDALVSSVPSGSRFHTKSTTLEVAVKLLKNKHQPFNIGNRIVEQATQDPQLRQSWKDDPSFRMKLSASELVAFQKFMDDNLEFAAKIERLPVIIFQGYSDQLVKPLGTLALYQAIRSKDKDLLFVGHAEHLILEEAQFDPDVVDGLSAWLSKHTHCVNAAATSTGKTE